MEAALRVWNRWGRRDNIHKQRIKILVHDLGAEEFTRQVEEEWQAILPNASDVPQAELDRIAAYFVAPPFETGLAHDVDPDRKSVVSGHRVSFSEDLGGCRHLKKKKQ